MLLDDALTPENDNLAMSLHTFCFDEANYQKLKLKYSDRE